MCEIIGKYTKEKTFTGYKVVVEDKYGHYYSPFTGIRYKKGKISTSIKVKHPNTITTICENKYVNPNWRYNGINWNDGMIGMTGVIIDKYIAKYYQDKWMIYTGGILK